MTAYERYYASGSRLTYPEWAEEQPDIPAPAPPSEGRTLLACPSHTGAGLSYSNAWADTLYAVKAAEGDDEPSEYRTMWEGK